MAGLTKEYRAEWDAWRHAKSCCLDPRNKNYPNYGGRGITICEAWLNSFPQFLADVGSKPNNSRLTWLGRRDINLGYFPENVKWVKHTRQIRSRRCCHQITLDGQRATLKETARRIGLPPETFWKRITKQGVSPEIAALGKHPPRKDSKLLTHNGQTLTVPQWARFLGIRNDTLFQRLKYGMPMDKALTPGLLDLHLYTLNGETRSLPEWAKVLGVTLSTLQQRVYRRGLPLERALMPGDHRKFRK